MNDMVSMRNMRPGAELFELAGAERNSAFLPAALSEAGAREEESKDFLRGGTSVSVAAGYWLEIYAEIRLHNLADLVAIRIAEYGIVLHRKIHGRGKIEVDRLIVRVLD